MRGCGGVLLLHSIRLLDIITLVSATLLMSTDGTIAAADTS